MGTKSGEDYDIALLCISIIRKQSLELSECEIFDSSINAYVQETYGEDSWLSDHLGTAFVTGLQGDELIKIPLLLQFIPWL